MCLSPKHEDLYFDDTVKFEAPGIVLLKINFF